MKITKRIPSEVTYGYYEIEADLTEAGKLSNFLNLAIEIEQQVNDARQAKLSAKEMTKVIGDDLLEIGNK